jgi:hypothetical protein
MGLASTEDRPFYTTEAYLQKYYREIMNPENTKFDRSEDNVDIYQFNNGKMIVKYNTSKQSICIQESSRERGVNPTSPIHTDDITIISRDDLNKLVKKLKELKIAKIPNFSVPNQQGMLLR